MSDPINPAHYQAHSSGVQSIEICEHLGFNVGNAIKYLYRAGLKPGANAATDHDKARWYLRRAAASDRMYAQGSIYCETAVARVMSCGPSLLTRVLQALVGGPAHFHAVTPRSIRNAIEVLDAEIAKMEAA